MIFEIVCGDDESITVTIDNYTYNEILKMLIVEAYHKGKSERLDDEINEE